MKTGMDIDQQKACHHQLAKGVDTDFPFLYITQIKENIYLIADKG
ncbi:MAG: hypothetical protein ACLUHA_13335 [Bacteroides stercoris]